MTKSFPAPLAARRPRGLHALVLAIGLVLAGGALDAEARDKEKDKDKEKDHGKVTVALNISAPTPAVAPAALELTAAAESAQSSHPVERVEYYQGATLIGSASTAPYRVSWHSVPAGSYTLTARAINDKGDTATSAPQPVRIDAPPTVTLTAPAASTVLTAPGSVTLAANAADSDGTIAKVDFYQGGTLLGTATTAPYAFIWTNVPAGTYTLTAQATDNNGAVTTSAAIPVSVNAPPTVSLTSPTNKQILLAPASVTITATATATDSDGTIQKVDFYQSGTLLGSATTAPYAFTWTNVPAGNYTLTAQATDNNGGTVTSSPVTVILDAPPSIALASPANNQRFTAPATIALTATATDTDGSIAKVDFYQGTTLLGTATMAPYTYTWANVGEGSYTLMAKATDNGGAETYSAQIAITVQSNGPKLYYLHTDHLDTPRAVTDETNKVIWRNLPLNEPFGMSPPEEDPDGDGISFTMNLRFPGQYFDRETNTNYNYYRDYDPNTGRYIQSDPIGLKGGINTYSYVEGGPVSKVDPEGLSGRAPGKGPYPSGQGPGTFPGLTTCTKVSLASVVCGNDEACSASIQGTYGNQEFCLECLTTAGVIGKGGVATAGNAAARALPGKLASQGVSAGAVAAANRFAGIWTNPLFTAAALAGAVPSVLETCKAGPAVCTARGSQ